jgi:hypothetical protein
VLKVKGRWSEAEEIPTIKYVIRVKIAKGERQFSL